MPLELLKRRYLPPVAESASGLRFPERWTLDRVLTPQNASRKRPGDERHRTVRATASGPDPSDISGCTGSPPAPGEKRRGPGGLLLRGSPLRSPSPDGP